MQKPLSVESGAAVPARMGAMRSWWLAGAFLVVGLVLGVQTWHKAHRAGGNDLTSYLLSAQALWQGQSPYGLETPFAYVYPMFLASLLVPWLMLPYGVSVLCWFAVTVAALGAVLRRSAGAVVPAAATAVILFAAIQNTLLNGQVNVLVVLCCVLAVAAVSRGRDLAAAAWLGAAIALKLMPAVLLVHLLVRRRTRAVVGTLLVTAGLVLLPGVRLGGEAWEAHATYVHRLLMPMARDGSVMRPDALTFSLSGVLRALLGEHWGLSLGILGPVVVVAAVTAIDLRRWRPGGQDVVAGAAYMLAILLISPLSELHHLVFAIPAVGLGCAWVRAGEPWSSPWLSLFGASASMLAVAPILGGRGQGVVTCLALMLLVVVLGRRAPAVTIPINGP